MGKERNRRYKLSYKAKEKRWRKIYQGKAHHFKLNDGETKESSYRRCLAEWQTLKAKIDAEAEQDRQQPKVQALEHAQTVATGLLNSMPEQYADTDDLRRAYTHFQARVVERQAEMFALDKINIEPEHLGETKVFMEQWLENQLSKFINSYGLRSKESLKHFDPEMVAAHLEQPQGMPPWEAQQLGRVQTIGDLVDVFIKEKQRESERDTISLDRFVKIRSLLESGLDKDKSKGTNLLGFLDKQQLLSEINGEQLRAYRELIQQEISQEAISASLGRDRWQAVKQMYDWAYAEDRIESYPKILKARYSFTVAPKEIELLSDAQIKQLLKGGSERTRLYLLLMLNAGMLQGDIAELRQDEVNWKQGTLTRKRSKTRNHEGVPTVTYQLWPETLELLKAHRAKEGDLVLVNERGGSLKREELKADGKLAKVCNISTACKRLMTKTKIKRPIKLLRKTAASMLGKHKEHSHYAQHYLGHSPRTVAEKHYVRPSDEQFAKALAWLREELKIEATLKEIRS